THSTCCNPQPPSDIYTLSLHDALPICNQSPGMAVRGRHFVHIHDRAELMQTEQFPRATVVVSAPSAIQDMAEAEESVCRRGGWRSEEHTSELQSRFDLVCRLLLEK